jgi:hypothetical protein
VFQIVGDAFCAAFHTASEGVAAALTAQRALTAEPWGATGPIRVRMALHTETADVHAAEHKSGEDMSGLTLTRTARATAVRGVWRPDPPVERHAGACPQRSAIPGGAARISAGIACATSRPRSTSTRWSHRICRTRFPHSSRSRWSPTTCRDSSRPSSGRERVIREATVFRLGHAYQGATSWHTCAPRL